MLLFTFSEVGATVADALRGTSPLEWVAVLTGFACVWLAAREALWNFPVAIVSCLLYIVIYYQKALYADSGLQVMFIALSGYGWYEWLYGGRGSTPLPISRVRPAEWLGAALFTAGFTAGFGYYLAHHSDSSFPYLDSFTTGTSLSAQFLLMRKRLENWWLWLLVDAIYVPVLWVKQLYPTSLLYAVYLALATYGYYQWRREAVSEQVSK